MEDSRELYEQITYGICMILRKKFKAACHASKFHSERSTSADQFSTGCLHWPHEIFFSRTNV